MYLIKDNKYKDTGLFKYFQKKIQTIEAKDGKIITNGFLKKGNIYNEDKFQYFGLIQDCIIIEVNKKIAEILYA